MRALDIQIAFIALGFLAMIAGMYPIAVPDGGRAPKWGRAQTVGTVTFAVGIVIVAIAALAALMWPTPARAETITKWQPPAGMEFHTADKKCNPTRNYGPYLEGCYFGAPDSTDHAGLAFFRKCGPYRQMMPFLVADFGKNEFTFYSNPSKPSAKTFSQKLNAAGDINPEPWLDQLPPVLCPYWNLPGLDI